MNHGSLRFAIVGAGMVLGAGGALAEGGSGDAWAAHCSHNLASRHLATPAVNAYCACMEGLGDDREMLKWDQKQLEKSFPYAHVRCVDRAAAAMQGTSGR